MGDKAGPTVCNIVLYIVWITEIGWMAEVDFVLETGISMVIKAGVMLVAMLLLMNEL